jgi:predicted DNA binding protein
MIEDGLAVEFRVQGDDCPLAEATKEVGSHVQAQPSQLRSDGNANLKFTTSKNEELKNVLDDDKRIRYLHVSECEDYFQYRCVSKHICVVHKLIDKGMIVEKLQYQNGIGIILGAVIGREALKTVMAGASETVGVKLERVYPVKMNVDMSLHKKWDITPAQEECIRTAVEMDYFSIPRESTSDEVAAELGISKSGFLDRLRRAEKSLFSQMYK